MSFFSTNPEVIQGISNVKAELLVAGTATIWSPPDANTRFIITDIVVMIQGGTSADIVIYEDANAIGNLIYRHSYDSTKGPVNHHHPYQLPYVPARGKAIKMDSSAGAQVRVVLHGYKAY